MFVEDDRSVSQCEGDSAASCKVVVDSEMDSIFAGLLGGFETSLKVENTKDVSRKLCQTQFFFEKHVFFDNQLSSMKPFLMFNQSNHTSYIKYMGVS